MIMAEWLFVVYTPHISMEGDAIVGIEDEQERLCGGGGGGSGGGGGGEEGKRKAGRV